MVKSYRGQEVDMNKIVKEQGNNMSVGNTNLNCRGDVVKNGVVVKSREERLAEWMKTHKETSSVNLAEDKNSKKIEEEMAKQSFEENKRVAKPRKPAVPNFESESQPNINEEVTE